MILESKYLHMEKNIWYWGVGGQHFLILASKSGKLKYWEAKTDLSQFSVVSTTKNWNRGDVGLFIGCEFVLSIFLKYEI